MGLICLRTEDSEDAEWINFSKNTPSSSQPLSAALRERKSLFLQTRSKTALLFHFFLSLVGTFSFTVALLSSEPVVVMNRYIFVTAGTTNGKTVVGDKLSDDRLMGFLEAYHSYDKGEWVTNMPPRKVLDKLCELGYKVQSLNEVSSEWSGALAREPNKRVLLWTLFKDDEEDIISHLPVRRESRIPQVSP